jgi:hypothetical protein
MFSYGNVFLKNNCSSCYKKLQFDFSVSTMTINYSFTEEEEGCFSK